MISMTTKYISKIKKDIYDYSCIIESIYKLNNNTLWNSYFNIRNDVENIIDDYIVLNYFNNMNKLNNPVSYFNENIAELKDYIKKYYSLMYDDEAVLLSIILCISTYFRKITEKRTLSKDQDFKKIIYKLIYSFKDIKQLNIKLDNKKIKRLSVKLYKTSLGNNNFFIEMNKIPKFNTYKHLNDNYYEVKLKIPNDIINQYNYKIVNDTLKKYNKQFSEISYQILGLKVLRDLINSNYNKKYIINFEACYLCNDEFLKVIKNDDIKRKIYLLLNFCDYGNNLKRIKELEKLGYNFIYNYNDEFSGDIFNYENLKLLVNDNFETIEKDELDSLKKRNIEIIKKS